MGLAMSALMDPQPCDCPAPGLPIPLSGCCGWGPLPPGVEETGRCGGCLEHAEFETVCQVCLGTLEEVK